MIKTLLSLLINKAIQFFSIHFVYIYLIFIIVDDAKKLLNKHFL